MKFTLILLILSFQLNSNIEGDCGLVLGILFSFQDLLIFIIILGEILESLSIQEGLRKPAYTAVDSEATHHKCNTYLRSLLLDDIHDKQVLDYLDT